MRFPVAYYLLLLYITVMLRPLMPLLGDAWDHAFAESIHIATVHAKYGANHLEKAMADAGADNNSKNQNTVKSVEVVPVHVPEEAVAIHFYFENVVSNYNRLQPCKTPPVFVSCHYPPPKFFI